MVLGANDIGILLLTVEHGELQEHLSARADYHERRTTALAAEADAEDVKAAAQLDAADTVTGRMEIKSSSNYGHQVQHREVLRQRAKAHAAKAVAFRYYAGHLPDDSAFLLNRTEAAALELIPGT